MDLSKGQKDEVKDMTRTTRHGVIEEVAIMIKTGASEKTVSNYIDKLYKNFEISDRVYCILNDMIVENF